jgi:hypothetical protein
MGQETGLLEAFRSRGGFLSPARGEVASGNVS